MSDTSRPPAPALALRPGLCLTLLCLPFLPAAVAPKHLVTLSATLVVALTMGRTVLGRLDIKKHMGTVSSTEKKQAAAAASAVAAAGQQQHDEAKACPICQEPVGTRTPEGVREGWSMLPCGHVFGDFCIKRYLAIAADDQPVCPMCRHVAYHDVCGHPVLPFLLRADGGHPDLVVDAAGRKCPPLGVDALSSTSCGYCQSPPSQSSDADADAADAEADADPKKLLPRAVRRRLLGQLGQLGHISAWKGPLRWLRAVVPFARKPARSPIEEESEEEGQEQPAVAAGESEQPPASAAPAAASSSHRLTRQEARTRRRTQGQGVTWEGPKLTAALNSLEKIAWLRLDDESVRFTVIPDTGSQVWASLSVDLIFDNYTIQSVEASNTINLELPLGPLQRALKSAIGSSYAHLRLTKRDGVPMLSMTIHTMTKDGAQDARGGFGNNNNNSGGANPPGRHNNPDPDDPFNDPDLFPQESLELTMKREREKVITQDIPVRVLHPDTVETIMQPHAREPDVHIQLPPLLQLKAISDRFTKLALTSSTTSATTRGGSTTNANPKLTLSANMHGTLRLRLATDALDITSVWHNLENPALDPAQLPMPLAEHPSTLFREAGPDKWATVRVDGRDWSKVLSVGRLEGRVIACFADERALILYVYVPHVDGGAEDVVTYYVTSYSP
ncbi:Hus1-like protein-domain-containing protein [Staphylotrichum tortipilum]|uniref:Hus1-like protein-domain-containing protein n=1 Tax=Staphylotrichum tortipilum TaxID=2831512 RepID=A0AAN6MJ23_9PEZI|nr:Hus1-like protein-domain-containing protein [Staphylotrichum longicolle]